MVQPQSAKMKVPCSLSGIWYRSDSPEKDRQCVIFQQRPCETKAEKLGISSVVKAAQVSTCLVLLDFELIRLRWDLWTTPWFSFGHGMGWLASLLRTFHLHCFIGLDITPQPQRICVFRKLKSPYVNTSLCKSFHCLLQCLALINYVKTSFRHSWCHVTAMWIFNQGFMIHNITQGFECSNHHLQVLD